jgi:DNA-binding CsgD family transcriptional regulator
MIAMVNEWPLVGRADEVTRLGQMLSGPAARGLVLAGEAGVGKTRLAAELAAMLEAEGVAVLRATATSSSTALPLGALGPLLSGLRHDEPGDSMDRSALLRRCADALVQVAGGRRLVLSIDDAHLLDDTSATLLHQLVTTHLAAALITVRAGMPTPAPVTALWKDGLVARTEVTGLSGPAMEELLTAALGGPVDRAAVLDLAGRCHGNVLYLRELVLGALGDGTLRDDGGLWRLTGPLSPSQRIVELVEERLGSRSPAERRLMEVVAFGEPVSATELGELRLAENLERAGLLVSVLRGSRVEIRMAHPLYGEVLRARLPAVRVPSIARELAEAAERDGGPLPERPSQDVLRIGTLRLSGGGGSAQLLLAAARIARSRYDFVLAERLAGAAWDGGAGFEAALLAAQAVGLQGRAAESERKLAALASHTGTDAQRARVALARLDNEAFYLGELGEANRIAEQAERTVTDPGWRDEITARRLGLLLATEGPRVAAAAAEPVLARAGGRALVWACQIGSFSIGRLGRLGEAREIATRGRAAHLELAEPLDSWHPWFHAFFEADAMAGLGLIDEAVQLCGTQYQRALDERSVEARAIFALQLTRSVGERGHAIAAARYGREAVALFRELGRPQFEYWSLQYLALALAVGGRAGEATDTLDALDSLGLPPTRNMVVDLQACRAWAAVAAGDLATGRRRLAEAAELGAKIGDVVGAAAALHAIGRLGAPSSAADRLAELAGEIDGPLAATRAAHLRALVDSDGDGLLTASVRFESCGALLLAAEAAADAALAWRQRSDRRAAAAQVRAEAVAARCEHPRTPALTRLDVRARLTPAELEVALAAAAGSSNREIAERHGVSVRTVESHLQRAYGKLGTSSRTDLGAALGSRRAQA